MSKSSHPWSPARLLGDVATLSTATVLGHLITVVAYPVLARMYPPEAFGVFGIVTAVAMVLSPLAGLSYPTAIFVPVGQREADDVAVLSTVVAGGIAVLAGAVLGLFMVLPGWQSGLGEVGGLAFLFSPLIVAFVVRDVSANQLVRSKRFGRVGFGSFLRSVVSNNAKIAFGLVSPVATSMALGYLLAETLEAAFLFFAYRRIRAQRSPAIDEPPPRWSHRELLKVAKRYRDFPLYRAPQVLINALSQGLPVLALTTFATMAEVGAFSLALASMGLPARFLTAAVKRAFYVHFSDALQGTADASKLLIGASVGLLLIGLIPFGCVAVFGPEVFVWVFGASWETAGEYGRWMSLWMLFSLANAPAVAAIPILRIQGWFLGFELVGTVLRGASIAIGVLWVGDAGGAVAGFAIVSAAVNAALIVAVCRRAQLAELSMLYANRA